jgi:Glycosyl transferase family 64 domain
MPFHCFHFVQRLPAKYFRAQQVSSLQSVKMARQQKALSGRPFLWSAFLFMAMFILWTRFSRDIVNPRTLDFATPAATGMLPEAWTMKPAIASATLDTGGEELHVDAAAPPVTLNTRNNTSHVDEASFVPLAFTKAYVDKASFIPLAFTKAYERALEKRDHCRDESSDLSSSSSSNATATTIVQGPNGQDVEIVSLPPFGVISALEDFPWRKEQNASRQDTSKSYFETCELPPDSHECNETMVTVVFMAYNEDRMHKVASTARTLATGFRDRRWLSLIAQVILVWNGRDDINETESGRQFMQFAAENSDKIRVVYPLKMGYANDLMNRYNPDILSENGKRPVLTKGLLFYDDDGPFYAYPAVLAGFELWKRHPRAQMGAMSRKFNLLSQRQQQEQKNIYEATDSGLLPPRDQRFLSHCPASGDMLDYEFHYFANYDANMVLPSGSILHRNYLCFVWHPVFKPIREFVLSHPSHPDDVTVSMIVSQVAGQAPRVYSRRINRNKGRRRLLERSQQDSQNASSLHVSRMNLYEEGIPEIKLAGHNPAIREMLQQQPSTFSNRSSSLQRRKRRRLLEGIDWGRAGEAEIKQYWLRIRAAAVNSLVQYFGSLNTGSVGWCENTPYYNPRAAGKCSPAMATEGWLPWMQNPEHVPKSTCP